MDRRLRLAISMGIRGRPWARNPVHDPVRRFLSLKGGSCVLAWRKVAHLQSFGRLRFSFRLVQRTARGRPSTFTTAVRTGAWRNDPAYARNGPSMWLSSVTTAQINLRHLAPDHFVRTTREKGSHRPGCGHLADRLPQHPCPIDESVKPALVFLFRERVSRTVVGATTPLRPCRGVLTAATPWRGRVRPQPGGRPARERRPKRQPGKSYHLTSAFRRDT